jgi:hypothetical protein
MLQGAVHVAQFLASLRDRLGESSSMAAGSQIMLSAYTQRAAASVVLPLAPVTAADAVTQVGSCATAPLPLG